MRPDLMKRAAENRKRIEKTLATAKRGMTLTEIARATGLPTSTVKRHLEKLIAIGRVHVESYGSFKVYFWNGDQVFQKKVFLSENHVLFVDAMINPWGKPFVRNPHTGEWEDKGAIIVDRTKIHDLISALASISENLDKYGEQS